MVTINVEKVLTTLLNPLVLGAIFAAWDLSVDETPTYKEAAGAAIPAMLGGLIFKTMIQGVPFRKAFTSF